VSCCTNQLFGELLILTMRWLKLSAVCLPC